MFRKIIEFAKKGEDLVKLLKAVLAGYEAFQKELAKSDSDVIKKDEASS